METIELNNRTNPNEDIELQKEVEVAVKKDDEINNRFKEEESVSSKLLSEIERENRRYYKLTEDLDELVSNFSIIEVEYQMRKDFIDERYGDGSSDDDEVLSKMEKFLKRTDDNMVKISGLIKESDRAIKVSLAVLGDTFYGVA